jgi:hypothetical protein
MNVVTMPFQMVQTIAVQSQQIVTETKSVVNQSSFSLIKVKRYDIPGQKSLVVVATKCPTELIGVNTPSTKIFHSLIDNGMSCINRTQILPMELRQACS